MGWGVNRERGGRDCRWEGGELTDCRMGQTGARGRDGEADWEVSQGKQEAWSPDGQRERWTVRDIEKPRLTDRDRETNAGR